MIGTRVPNQASICLIRNSTEMVLITKILVTFGIKFQTFYMFTRDWGLNYVLTLFVHCLYLQIHDVLWSSKVRFEIDVVVAKKTTHDPELWWESTLIPDKFYQ